MAVEVRIAGDVTTRFPEICVGGFVAGGLATAGERLPDRRELTEMARRRLSSATTLETLSTEPRIAAWRRAFRECGLRSSDFRSSPEQLARRILRDRAIATPLPVVDAYCALSAAHLSPLGAYDIDRLPCQRLDLRGSAEDDRFEPLGAPPKEPPLDAGVVVYAAGDEVVCWGFNYRDSKRTCLQSGTRNGVFLGEAVSRPQRDSLLAALRELRDLLVRAGATASEIDLADAARPRLSVGPGT